MPSSYIIQCLGFVIWKFRVGSPQTLCIRNLDILWKMTNSRKKSFDQCQDVTDLVEMDLSLMYCTLYNSVRM